LTGILYFANVVGNDYYHHIEISICQAHFREFFDIPTISDVFGAKGS